MKRIRNGRGEGGGGARPRDIACIEKSYQEEEEMKLTDAGGGIVISAISSVSVSTPADHDGRCHDGGPPIDHRRRRRSGGGGHR
jgi:hypothetical protein